MKEQKQRQKKKEKGIKESDCMRRGMSVGAQNRKAQKGCPLTLGI